MRKRRGRARGGDRRPKITQGLSLFPSRIENETRLEACPNSGSQEKGKKIIIGRGSLVCSLPTETLGPEVVVSS